MKRRFIFIATLALSFALPVALSGLGVPVGEAIAQNKRYSVDVEGTWAAQKKATPDGGLRKPGQPVTMRGTYESNALTAVGARTSAISQFKKDFPNYHGNVKATATREIKPPPAPKQTLGQRTINAIDQNNNFKSPR